MSGAEPFPPAPADFFPPCREGFLCRSKKTTQTPSGFPEGKGRKFPTSLSLPRPACLAPLPSVYAIKSEPTTTSRRLTDQHEFWIGATTMTRRESSKSRQRVIYQPTTAHCTRPQVFSLSQPIYESSRKSGEELLTFPIQGGAPIMHAVVMACVCRACKRERGGEREGEPKQICKYFIERPRPRGPPQN